MHENIRRYAVWGLVAVSVMVCGYLYLQTSPAHKSASLPEHITIAYSASPDSALAQVAQAKGYYLKEGLDAVPHKHAYGKVALEEVLKGKADFATVAETPLMFAIMKGEKISVIATIQTSNRNNVIIARKDRGIHSPGDLKGRKIAATSGTLLDFFLDSYLATIGIARKTVNVIDMKPEEMVGAVVKGEVDAISAWSHVIIETQQRLGDKGITFLDENIYTQTFNVVATQEFIRRNPEKVRSLLRALIEAEEFVSRNPEEAQAIVAAFCRIDKAVVEKMWSVEKFSVTLDQSLVLALEDESVWAIKSGFIDKVTVPNYLNYIYVEGLKSVKPDAVRIL